jgi:Amt family ammonium transporter
MAFYAFAATLITWVLWAYKMGFGIYMLPFVGRPGPVVTMAQELGQSQLPSTSPVLFQNFPLSTMVYFQFVFAAITVIILAGAVLGRMNFTAWMIFVPLWITFSYTIGAYSIWGGGYLFQMGVIDYSGGYVIHISSGTAGFVAAHWIGPRLKEDREESRPSNMLAVLTGAGILWLGWNGFNGGDPYAASADAGVAVLNTNVATAMSLLCWTICDMIYYKKPSVIGAVQGMITGLVAITPAAGVVAGWGAICIGFASGTIPWLSMNIMGKKVAYFRKIDDTLGVFHTHCVAGFVGGFCAGLFATIEGCAAFGLTNPGGAIEGNGKQVWLQYVSSVKFIFFGFKFQSAWFNCSHSTLYTNGTCRIVGALFVIGWNIVWTSLILLFIKYVCRIPLRMSEEELIAGSDLIHGEAPYVLGPCEAHEHLLPGNYIRKAGTNPGELPLGGVTMGQDPHGGKQSGSGTPEAKRD